jgi:outer membrane protein assembly factor BamB
VNRRLVIAIALVASTASACGPAEQRAVPRQRLRRPAEPVANVHHASTVSWSTATDGAPVAIAADRGGEVVTVDHERVGALDQNGRVLWSAELDDVVGAVPVLMGDRVIVPFSRTNGSGGCAGLDRATGAMRWRYEAMNTGGVAVARAGALVLCLLRNGQTAAMTPSWGSPRWEFTFQGDVDSSIIEVPTGTAMAVDESTGIFAFVARLGAQWQLTTRSIENGQTQASLDLGAAGPPSAPALVAVGFIGVASGAGELEFVRLRTRELMRFPIPVADGFDPATPPLRVEGVVIVAGRAGEVIAFDLGSDRPRWTAQAVGPFRGAHPVVVGNAVMLQTWTGELVAFRLADGASIRIPPDPGRAVAMLMYAGPGVVYAVGQDGDAGWIERWEPKLGS